MDRLPSARDSGRGGESLDYEAVANQVWYRKHGSRPQFRHIYGYTGQTFGRLLATLTAGIAIGLTAAALQLAVDASVIARNQLLGRLFLQGLPHGLAAMLGIGLAAVLLTTLVVHYWAPRAAGGGVALVMAFLNGNRIDNLLSGRVYVVKLLGTTASRVAGLALGVEGPMVHLGASVASLACHVEYVVYRLLRALSPKGSSGNHDDLHTQWQEEGLPSTPTRTPSGQPQDSEGFVFSNSDHRELVSAGAAAGLAAAFGAPIGGVLFALEEATSVWGRKLAWRCFLCASVACFTMAQLHPRMQSGMLTFRGIYPLTNVQWLIQGPLVVVVSACGGLLGCVFNLLKGKARGWRRSHSGISWRLLEAAVVVAVTAAAVTGLPALAGTCLQMPDQWAHRPNAVANVVRHRCPEGQYNDLATAFLGNAVWVIRSFLSLGSDTEPVNRLCSLTTPCYYTAHTLAVLVLVYFVLFILASNLVVPGGLFMPCILIGSALGALLGLLLLQLLGPSWDIQPGVYALVCATAMLGACFRSSISLVVIILEGTQGIELLFGIIMAVIVSNWVAHHLHPDGVYEAELDRKEGGTWHYLRQEPPHALRGHSAESIMASPAVGLHSIDRVDAVLDVLRRTTHNGFPVLSRPLHPKGPASSKAPQGGRLEGFVLRSQLLTLLRHGAFCDQHGCYLHPRHAEDPAAFEAALDAEMQAAAQANGSAPCCRHLDSAGPFLDCTAASGAGGSAGGLGLLGPTTGCSIVGLSLNASSSSDSLQQEAVLTAAAKSAALAAPLAGGSAAYLNLEPFMQLAPMTVRPQMPGDRVHHLFLSLSLRHLCVTDSHCRCLGIITRKDIDHACGQGWWRANEIAPTPHQSPRQLSGASGRGSPLGLQFLSVDNILRSMSFPSWHKPDSLELFLSQGLPGAWREHAQRAGDEVEAPALLLGGSNRGEREPLWDEGRLDSDTLLPGPYL